MFPGAARHFLTDQVDSVKVVTDESGLAVSSFEYFPFGSTWFEQKAKDSLEDFAPKFNSQEFDQETGFYYYNARYYEPEISRFVTADNVIDGEYSTQGWNRYSYVKNNPIKYSDPTGHEASDILGGMATGFFSQYENMSIPQKANVAFQAIRHDMAKLEHKSREVLNVTKQTLGRLAQIWARKANNNSNNPTCVVYGVAMLAAKSVEFILPEKLSDLNLENISSGPLAGIKNQKVAIQIEKSVVKSGKKGCVATWLHIKKGAEFFFGDARKYLRDFFGKKHHKGLKDNFINLTPANKFDNSTKTMKGVLQTLANSGFDVTESISNMERTKLIKQLYREGKYYELKKIVSPQEWDDIINIYKK